MGFTAAKLLNKVRKALTKPKKKSPAQESMNYRKKLSREQNKRAKNEDLLPGETRPKSKVKKKADKVEQMSDARLKREKQLANPYLTYEDRAKLLGGFKEVGKVERFKKPKRLKKSPRPNFLNKKSKKNMTKKQIKNQANVRPIKSKETSASFFFKDGERPDKDIRGTKGRLAKMVKAKEKANKPGGKNYPKTMMASKTRMKHGGSVKGKCRMDGIAVRGRTRAKERSK